MEKPLNKARNKFVADEIEKNDYHDFRKQCEEEIVRLEAELIELSKTKLDISEYVSGAVRNFSKVSELFDEGKIEERRKVISTIFPQKLVFDGMNFRTPRINEAVRLIFNISEGFGGNEDEDCGSGNKAKSSSGSRLTEKITFSILNSRTTFEENDDPLKVNGSEGLDIKKSGLNELIFVKSTSVARHGFEPRHTEPKSVVLPLYYRAIRTFLSNGVQK